MQKTLHYELKKPEITDPLRVTDFNENNDLIDAALAAKAEKSAVTAVENALASKANTSAVTTVETALANYKTTNDAAVAAAATKANAASSASNSPFAFVTVDTSAMVEGDTVYTFSTAPKFVILQGTYSNALIQNGKRVCLVDAKTPSVTSYAMFELSGNVLTMPARLDASVGIILTILIHY